ncbi:hypothetical protein PIB30_089958 [Stylosanthes scabra]|uniref:Uncharacterized protein n=1 Tax=Stylosanthes scabra TaxID=79078 RepID=A0ABU6ZSS0_9FABA|nr:hypothetical protein [Stylosanthes scabra]
MKKLDGGRGLGSDGGSFDKNGASDSTHGGVVTRRRQSSTTAAPPLLFVLVVLPLSPFLGPRLFSVNQGQRRDGDGGAARSGGNKDVSTGAVILSFKPSLSLFDLSLL